MQNGWQMSRPKKRAPRVTVRRVEHHPRPFESPLRPHFETIRSLRRAHKTWQDIAKILREEHGIKTSHSTVHAFFKRVTERAKKGKAIVPLGYEEEAAPAAVPDGPAQPASTAPPLDQSAEPVPEAQEHRTAEDLARVRKKPPFNPFA